MRSALECCSPAATVCELCVALNTNSFLSVMLCLLCVLMGKRDCG